MKIQVFIFLSFFLINQNFSFCQNENDVKECLIQLFEQEEINSIIFSLNTEVEDSILCIKGDIYNVEGKNIILLTEHFEDYLKHKIYVKSPSFLEMYAVDYWFSIDSLQIGLDTIYIEFKTTTSYKENKSYTYIIGKAKFHKIRNEWLLPMKEIEIGKYKPPFVINEKYIKNVRERNLELIEQLQKNNKE